ncbi:MAG: hypothetical protein ACKO7W_23505 [Elainella sp.]
MKLTLIRTGLMLGLSIGAVGQATVGLAQGVDPLDANERRTADPFSNTETTTTDTFFDLMHRVQLGTVRSVSEYGRDQQENIGSQASDFRTRQRELLQQQSAQPTTTVETAPVQPAQPNSY